MNVTRLSTRINNICNLLSRYSYILSNKPKNPEFHAIMKFALPTINGSWDKMPVKLAEININLTVIALG